MEQLRRLAGYEAERKVVLPTGAEVAVAAWGVDFARASPAYLTDPAVPGTYRSKPLVTVGSEALFGELAIVRLLEQDSWSAVWVDTFHGKGRRLLWRDAPTAGRRCEFIAGSPQEQLYDRIVRLNRGPGGFFDVFAWRGEEIAFFEYKGQGDSPNRNEARWIASALEAVVAPDQLCIIEYPKHGQAEFTRAE
jgi:hypothetical protein